MRELPSGELVGRLRVAQALRMELEPDTVEASRADGELRSLRRAYHRQVAERWASPERPGRDLASRS